jgi:hypothetical protein
MDTLETATGDEMLDGASLQASIDALEAMAKSLDTDIATAVGIDALQAIGSAQVSLRNRAQELIDAQISLLAGQLKITAGHINAAAQYAKDTVAQLVEWKKKIDTAAKVVEFFGVVMTGDGAMIFEAAIKLKAALG